MSLVWETAAATGRRMHSDCLISPWLPHLLPSITSRSPAIRAKAKIKGEQASKISETQ